MSTQQAVMQVNRVEVVCSCGTHFSLRERDYINRKRNNGGKEPSCSIQCGFKDRREKKVSISCECGCGQMVKLSEIRLKTKRTQGEQIFFSRACGRRLRIVGIQHEEKPEPKKCCWCDDQAFYFNGLEGNNWAGSCEKHTYKLSNTMLSRAEQVSVSVANQIIEQEKQNQWDKRDDWILDHLVAGRFVGVGG